MTTECTLCPLRGRPIPGYSEHPDPELIVIGEAPGREEKEQGRPFVGPAGKLLRGLLVEAGWDPARVHFTNRVWCFPEDELDKAIITCPKHYLLPELASLSRVRIVVTVGKVSSSLFFPGLTMKQMEGKARVCRTAFDDGVRIHLATYHPAHVLRGNRSARERILATLIRARGLLSWFS